MYRRSISEPLLEQQSFFLFGPRGTGKTTWLRSEIKDGFFIDLLDSDYFHALQANPSRLEGIIPKKHRSWVILDEVQRVPALLNEVHRLIEHKKIAFILTGSSARALRKKGVNLLAGRAIKYHLYPLTVRELGADFDILKSLQFGHLPSVFQTKSPEKYLKTYIQTYLREEVLQEGLTRNIGLFSRFLEIASFSQGSLLNVATIAREIGVDRMTIENYFTILEDLLIGYRIPVFSKRAKRKLVAHSKFYFFDVGVYKAIRPMGPFDTPDEADGAGLETLVLQELLACNEYGNLGYQLYFWRAGTGQEVDFVLYGQRGVVGIEVKRSSRIGRSDLSGLTLFKSDYPEATCYCFYGGSRKEVMDGITLMPLPTAMQTIADLIS